MDDETISRIVALWEEFKKRPFPDIENQKYWTVRNWTSKKRRWRRSLKLHGEEIQWEELLSTYLDIYDQVNQLSNYGRFYDSSWRMRGNIAFAAVRLERYLPKLKLEAKDYFDDMRAVAERIVSEINRAKS